MKVIALRLAAVLLVSCCIFSCKKEFVDTQSPTKLDEKTSVSITPTTIFAPGLHNFTDIHICYDDKVFLLEGGKLKRLVGTDLVDVPLPASVYKDFDPKFLTISKDFTFYLRANTGIKIIKSGKEIGYYKVGQAPLENFTPNTFGNFEIEVDETDHSLVFGTVRFGFDSTSYAIAKITKDGHYGDITFPNVVEQFITAFGLGPSTGEIWSGNLETNGNSYFDGLLKSTVSTPPFTYGNTKLYGQHPSTHISFPTEGPIDSVEFAVISGITVSKNSKVVYYKTGSFGEEEDVDGVNSFGNVFKIEDGIVKRLTENVDGKRLAISNNGKTLYIAGKGLSKIEL
ncbi:hypothetical protein FFF34_012585 [Inquilinus sp. KBS0705]|nr:hypothetical protein FFF34_012585 [Inquilinus sp. KBS0705]